MILTQISSGLGNQLFQYAFGQVLAQRHGVPLRLETYWFEHEINHSFRAYGLSYFNVTAPKATWQEIDAYLHADTRLHRLTHPYYKRVCIQERGHRFDANFRRYPAHTYVKGYWQCWQYYQEHRPLLLRDLSLKEPPAPALQPLLEALQAGPSVAVHLRRGDYTTNAGFNTLPLSYYEQASAYLRQRYENLRWYVFSDDIGWARQNLHFLDGATFMEGLSDVDDFRLMQQARYHIIANSTFSWWAAWLKQQQGQPVLAPRQPFQNTQLYLPHEFFPPDFVLI